LKKVLAESFGMVLNYSVFNITLLLVEIRCLEAECIQQNDSALFVFGNHIALGYLFFSQRDRCILRKEVIGEGRK
jgi:hypothetical protein